MTLLVGPSQKKVEKVKKKKDRVEEEKEKKEKKAAVGIYVQQCIDSMPCPAGRGCYVMQSVPWD